VALVLAALGLGLARSCSPAAAAPAPTTNPTASATPPRRAPAEDDLAPLRSLDAYLQGESRSLAGDRDGAVAAWQQSAEYDPASLPPRLALAGSLLRRDPVRAAEAAREALTLSLSDFRTVRWMTENCVLALALAGTLAALLILIGLLGRHLRAIQHLLAESLAWSWGGGKGIPLAAWALLAVPLLAGLGPLATGLFYLFLCAFRFSRQERLLALGLAAWAILIGPTLQLARPFWGQAPDGRDARLIYEVQREPTSVPSAAAIDGWLRVEPDGSVPLFLAGLARLQAGNGVEAEALLSRDAATHESPPEALEVNLGNAALLRGRRPEAEDHYRRALGYDRHSFEAQYNLSLMLAAEGDFDAADQAVERAGQANLDRLRHLNRVGPQSGPRRPIPALWSWTDLFLWDLRHPGAALPPTSLVDSLSLHDLLWSGPIAFLCALLGWAVGRRLRFWLVVRVCYQCGRPVCRRCLKRISRRAYCPPCAREMEGLNAGDSTRRLIDGLIRRRGRGTARALRGLPYWLPGTGAILRGNLAAGSLGAALAGLGVVLCLFSWWGRPYFVIGHDPSTVGLVRLLGLVISLVAFAVTAIGIHAAHRRQDTVRAYLDRDVDRAAA